jgi:MFS superfamily sulfate permease-like transporter
VSLASSVALTLAVRADGPLYGEVGMARWMRDNTPPAIDLFAEIVDPAITHIWLTLVLGAIVLLVWWRWGRYPAVILGLAGALTGLTRVGDLVNRPRPTSAVTWTDHETAHPRETSARSSQTQNHCGVPTPAPPHQ